MRLLGILAALVTSCGVAVGQVHLQRTLDLRNVFTTVEKRGDTVMGKDGAADGFCRIINMLYYTESDAAEPRRKRPLTQVVRAGSTMWFVGEQAHADCVEGILEQLRLPAHPEMRVQCTLLTMPLELAKAHGLKRGRPKPMDEATAGQLLKKTIQQKGTLKNLPECGGLPLQPFFIEPRATEHSTDKHYVHCEGVMLDAKNAAFAVKVIQGQKQEGAPKVGPIIETFRVELGKGVMLMWPPNLRARKGDQATVLWFRFISAKVTDKPRPDREK